MELTRRDLLKGAAALGAAADGAPGRAAAPPRPRPPRRGSWSSPRAGDISKFDPHFSTSSNDIRVSFNLFDNLTSRHPDGKLYPGLATEWKLAGPDRRGRSSCARASSSTTAIRSPRPTPSSASSGRTIPAAKTMVATVAHHHRADRGAGSRTRSSSTPRSRIRCCPRGWPSTAARSCRRSIWSRSGNDDVQRQAGRHRPGALRVVGQGRQGRARRQPRLLGRQDRRRPLDHPRRSRRRRRASPRCSRARSTSSPSSRPTRASA